MDNQGGISPSIRNFCRGLVGALIGGIAGYFAFGWLAGQGFYAMAVPGLALGVGAGAAAPRRSLPLAISCGVLALALSIFAEWKNFPFASNDSLEYFVTHLFDLRPFTLLMFALGALGGFWFAWRAGGRARNQPTSAPQNPS